MTPEKLSQARQQALIQCGVLAVERIKLETDLAVCIRELGKAAQDARFLLDEKAEGSK